MLAVIADALTAVVELLGITNVIQHYNLPPKLSAQSLIQLG